MIMSFFFSFLCESRLYLNCGVKYNVDLISQINTELSAVKEDLKNSGLNGTENLACAILMQCSSSLAVKPTRSRLFSEFIINVKRIGFYIR